MQMPIPIQFSLLGKDASILHFIRPLFGLLHLITLADCECSPFPLTTLLSIKQMLLKLTFQILSNPI